MKKERKNRGLSAGLVFAALLTIWATALSAQNVTGTILGTVTDPGGSVLPNVTVTITNADQKVVLRRVSTDDHGQFVVPGLPVGHYDVAAEITGFNKAIQSGIVLNVDDKVAVNFSLYVGSVSETVHVEANALQVDTETATATGVISGLQLRELSLNSRNYAQLVLLVPGASFRQRRPDFSRRHRSAGNQPSDLPNQRWPPRGKQLAGRRR